MTLLPIGIGCILGIGGFTYAIEYLLSRHTFVTCMAFVGLILGGIPILYRSMYVKMKESSSSIGISGVLSFLILFSVAVVLPLLQSDKEMMSSLTATPQTVILLLFIGIIASATMVVPGVSGSMVLMILGYYYGIIESVKTFLDGLKAFDMAVLMDRGLVLVPFGIGVILGIFLIAKLITFLFEKYGVETYCAIFGLILASPFAIFYNTGLFGQLSSLGFMTILSGIILAAAGCVITYIVGEQ